MTRSDWVSALAAVLSGTGGVWAAVYALRTQRKRLEQDFERRLQLFREGIRIGKGKDEVDS